MKAAIEKIQKALSRQDLVRHLNYYLFRDNYIYASDGRMTAAVPFEYDGTFLVPGEDLEKFLNRIPNSGITISKDPNSVTLRSGRFHCTIEISNTLEYDIQLPNPSVWSDPPEQFLARLKLIEPFISDNATHYWSLCAALIGNRIYATNNVCVAYAECQNLNGIGSLLPGWAVRYILSRTDKLTDIQFSENFAAFRWQDNSWMRTQLYQGSFPEIETEKYLTECGDPVWEIPKEWSEAFNIISGLSESIVEITGASLLGEYNKSKVQVEVKSPIPEDGIGVSYWNSTFLVPVINCSTHWSPQSWPKPAPFKGPGIRGIIMGRRP